ncbi:MAG: AAA family ATPase, partial [Dehalococcoidia bacterium]|nr:AAA family ATPase [Dehalococcoidia bacterium]
VFRFANDPVAKDAARIYYLPSCRPGAEHFARHNPGEILDPYALPPASRPAVATESPTPGEDGSKPKVPLGKTALDFVANGAPIGQQRERALAAARNYLSAGYSEKEAAEAIWRGLQASSQDPDRDPWAKDEAIAIVLDLAGKPAPPLKELPPKPGDVPPQNGREHPSGQPPAVRRPVVVRLDSVTPEQVEFLWHPYIPLGKLTILEGDPGLGKSWLALAIAAAISRGVKLPGATDPWGPADILLLSAEDGLADTITPRLDAMGADRGRITAITGIATDKGERGFSLAEHLDLLEEVLTQYRPIFVILDPLVSFLGAGVDMYRANEVRAILAPLASLAERCRAAILAIRHLTKSGRDKAIYRGQGNIDFVAAARSVILAGKEA